MPVASLAAGFLPVLLLLTGLQLMDSYKLVHGRMLFAALIAGSIAAGLAYLLNRLALDVAHADWLLLSRVQAPLLEEALKAAFVTWLIRSGRVGFMVDAAICGFAVGTGFGLVENLYFAAVLHDPTLLLWLARGLGAAVMHGGTSAMFAILTQGASERSGSTGLPELLPGYALAAAVHALFNLLARYPLIEAAVIIVTVPPLLVLVFESSERATRDWLGTNLDAEVALLEQIKNGEVAGTRIGDYLESLRQRFPDAVVADMFCLLRVHLELSLRAKGMLMARSVDLDVRPDEYVRANLEELRFLERSIGPTGQLALLPLRQRSRRDLWQIMVLSRRVESRKGP